MISRRQALTTILALVSAATLPIAGCSRTSVPKSATSTRLGVQLFTLRALLENDFDRTLEAVVAIGYEEFEFVDYYGRSPVEINSRLNDLGVTAPSRHLIPDFGRHPADLVGEAGERAMAEAVQVHDDNMLNVVTQALDDAAIVGHDYLVWGWIPGSTWDSLDNVQRLAERLNAAGELCAAADVRLCLHPHTVEFGEIGGKMPFEVIMENTDASALGVQLDVYWATKGGLDPVDLLEAYRDRTYTFHIKDMGLDGEIVNVGDGVIDFERIVRAGRHVGIEHMFVEHDNTRDPMQTLESSYAHLAPIISKLPS